jgi:hypothetical protein
LHWQFSGYGVVFPLRAAEVWPKLIEAPIAGRTVPSLAHDDLALFLAAHGTKEGWRRMLWLCDFAEFLRRFQDLDWIAILERAARSHSSRQLLLAIELAATMRDPLSQQKEEDLLWIRDEFLLSDENFGKFIVHGHTPVPRPVWPQQNQHRYWSLCHWHPHPVDCSRRSNGRN